MREVSVLLADSLQLSKERALPATKMSQPVPAASPPLPSQSP